MSGTNVGFNANYQPASFGSDTAFSLQSLYITKAWQDGFTNIQGYSESSLVYTASIYSTTTSPTLATLNWTNLTSVIIYDGDGTFQSAVDNITINAVPEPETYVMLLAGLGLVGFAARRRA